jgi:hypothetical protein
MKVGGAAMKNRTWLIVTGLFLLFGGLQVSAFAMPRGGGFHGGIGGGMHWGSGGHFGGFRGRIFVGPAFGFGWGWGVPWYGDPYYYPGPDVVEVHHVNYGSIEFKVKPESTKVYVDRKFIGTVGDLDHHKAFMPAGNHEIKLAAPDGKVLDRTIYVAAGQKIKMAEKF